MNNISISLRFPFIHIPDEKRPVVYTVIELFLISLFTGAIIILAAQSNGIWLDETYSLVLTQHDWKNLFLLGKNDVHPYLYFIILKCVVGVFGYNLFVLKLVSVLPVVATVILTSFFLKKECSDRAAVLFLLFSFASANLLHFSIEIRMYSWALFFVTSSAICVWYIIKTGKTKDWILFLLFAEGAAYTHYYATVAIAIGFLLLFIYLWTYDRKKIRAAILCAVAALLLFLPYLPTFLFNFSKVSHGFWITPITFAKVVGYFEFIFKSGGTFIGTGIIFFLFVTLVCVFFVKKKKTKMDIFAFGGLNCLILLLVAGLVVSFLTRPLLLDRYLFPACGMVWLFLAVECASISNKRIVGFIAGLLLLLDLVTFVGILKEERQEGKEFDRFYTYFSEAIHSDDLFIYPNSTNNSVETLSFLFPGHTHITTPYRRPHFFELHSTWADPAALSDSLQFINRTTWLFVPKEYHKNQSAGFASTPEITFQGIYGWGRSSLFAVYRAESATAFISILNDE